MLPISLAYHRSSRLLPFKWHLLLNYHIQASSSHTLDLIWAVHTKLSPKDYSMFFPTQFWRQNTLPLALFIMNNALCNHPVSPTHCSIHIHLKSLCHWPLSANHLYFWRIITHPSIFNTQLAITSKIFCATDWLLIQ